MQPTPRVEPAAIRCGIVTAAAASSILALGFAPSPQLFFVLGACMIIGLVAVLTGPKTTGTDWNLPTTLLTVIAAVATLGLRDTSLVWALVPVLAFVVAALTWTVMVNRYDHVAVHTAGANEAMVEELEPQRKTAAASDEPSATAA